jgi:hypothetical protein
MIKMTLIMMVILAIISPLFRVLLLVLIVGGLWAMV